MKKLLLAILILFPFIASAQLKINEIMTNNVSAVIDETYNYSMWVELYNSSTTTSYNQAAYFLTDDLTHLLKWKPSSKLISPGGFSLLVFENPTFPGHSSFKLDPEGGKLYLVNLLSQLVDSVVYPAQFRNISYGRKTNGTNDWVFFEQYSANASNNGKIWATQRCTKPVFKLAGGFYPSAQKLTFETPASNDTIYYTLNGAEPTKLNSTRYIPGSFSTIYSTTVVRAKSFSATKLSSDIATCTYFINERNFHLPVASIVTAQANLTDNTIGIYVVGTNGITGNGMTTPVNWNQDWDRPVNFELFDTTNVSRLNQELNIAMSGGWSRMNPQKSLKIGPSKKFGDNQLRYDIFAASKPNHKYKDIQLRNSGNDFYYSMMRDAFMESIVMKRMDLDCSAYEPAVCFMNGVYYGIQNLRERSNEDFIYSNYGLDAEDIDLAETWNIPNDTSYQPLSNYITQNDITKPAVYNKVSEMMDVDNFANYMISEIYFGNTDWPDNNVKIWKKKVGGKWRWIMYDTDFGFNLYDTNLHNHNTLIYALGEMTSDIPLTWSTLLLKRLILNDTFRNKFIDRFSVQLSTTFETSRVNHIMDSLSVKISKEIVYHKAKWGSYRSFSDDLSNMKVFSTNRPGNMLSYISSRFLSSVATQTVNITSNITNATYTMNSEPIIGSTVSLKYFRNRLMAIEAKQIAGYKFVQWELTTPSNSTPIIFTVPVYSTTLIANINLKAIYEKSTVDDPKVNATVVLNELVASNNLIADEFGGKDDYIELYNYGNQDVNIAGWYLTDTPANRVLSQIPSSDTTKTKIPAKGRIVLWADGQPEQGALHLGFKLGKEGETIILSKNGLSGTILLVDSVTFPVMDQNLSYSRVPDGSSNWIIQATTFNKTNDAISATENLQTASVLIYPTLVNDLFKLQNANGSIVIIRDLTGKILYRNKCQSETESIHVGFLQRGLYLVSVGNDSYKIVKL